MTDLPTSLPTSARVLALGFVGSGLVHLVRPETFEPLMPPWVPRHREVIHASGVAELLCAAAMVHPGTRRIGGWASAALLVAIFPAHVQMAQDAHRSGNRRFRAIAYGRLPLPLPLPLPLQVPVIRAALRATRG